ncbi:helix-turn-helix domain-containing protein [Nocardia sp. NPDC127579]|uniref:helix-turn-helix domain-containing protein n=1 Tax=Nocardia sp. NPDC127579 TaxID=3345402 RepID=UPI00363C8401
MGSVQFDSLSIGERLQIRRRRRGLSRRVLAGLVGRSEEWLRLVESGRSQLDSIEVVTRLAHVLQVDNPAELIDWPVPESRRLTPEQPILHALHEAVIDHPALNVRGIASPAENRSITDLAEDLERCRTQWTGAYDRYANLASALPPVLRKCRSARWRLQDQRSGELLVGAYHLARVLLAGTGSHSMASTVADRAIGTAAQLHSPELIAISAWHVSQSLLDLSILDASQAYALAAATRLERTGRGDEDSFRLCSALRLVAARAAAFERASSDADRLIAEARAAAAELGDDVDIAMIPFGPIEVSLTEMEIAAQHNATDEVLRIADRLEIPEQHAPARRVRYYIYQANAYAARRDDASVVLALSRAAEISPEDLRYDATAHRCIQQVLRRGNVIARREIHRLAALAGLS